MEALLLKELEDILEAMVRPAAPVTKLSTSLASSTASVEPLSDFIGVTTEAVLLEMDVI